MEFVWETPPPKGRREPLIDWYAVAAELKKRPGQWALVLKDVARQNVNRVHSGDNKAFRDGVYEARARNIGTYDKPGNGDLYIRYIGPNR